MEIDGLYIPGRRRPRKIDPFDAFFCWITGGTCERAASLYEERYGIKVSRSGIRNSAITWIVFYPDKAREYFKQDKTSLGRWENDEEWNKYLIDCATSVFREQPDNFIIWADRYGIYEKYPDVIEARLESIKKRYFRNLSR